MKKTILLLFILLSSLTFAQRKLPYPIVLIHGLGGGSEKTWTEFSAYLKNTAQLSVCPVPLNLQFNNNRTNPKFEVGFGFDKIGNYDVYILNFDWSTVKSLGGDYSLNNQSAIIKQGAAVAFAITEITKQSGCQRVMLLGHSMGGLAAREYLQNPYLTHQQNLVAKLVTIGTPHAGSNMGIGGVNISLIKDIDIRSEAVRDLRTSYKTGKQGVYLFGGYETPTFIQLGWGVDEFYNLDVNCNGQTGDLITGLNQRDLPPLPEYACIIGGPTISDGIVTVGSQNLKTIYPSAKIDLIYYNCKNTIIPCHLLETKDAFLEMMQGIDETKTLLTPMIVGQEISGFFQKQPNGSAIDTDDFGIFIPSKGIFNVSASFANGVSPTIRLHEANGNFSFDKTVPLNNGNTAIEVAQAGTYIISLTGNSLAGWAKYNINTSINAVAACDAPTSINILANTYGPVGQQPNQLCEGYVGTLVVGSPALDTPGEYDNYSWRKDGKEFASTTKNNTSFSGAGAYSVEITKCGKKVLSNIIIITAIPNPKPTLKYEALTDKYLLTSSHEANQWILNEQPQGKARVGNTNITNLEGVWYVQGYTAGCTNVSNKIIIKTEKPSIKIVGKDVVCEGDTVKLETDKLFSKYVWKLGKDSIVTSINKLSVLKTQDISVVAFRGTSRSPESDKVSIKINVLPKSITIFTNSIVTFDNELCEGNIAEISVDGPPSGAKGEYDNYSWRKDGKEFASTSINYTTFSSAGAYSLEITKCGKKVVSNTIVITAKPNPKPTLKYEELTDKYLLTSSHAANAWIFNGEQQAKATLGSTYTTNLEGVWQAIGYTAGCTNLSNKIIIKTEKPSIKIIGKDVVCEGDTVKLETDKLFSKFVWKIGKDSIITSINKLSVLKTQDVSVVAYRGISKSPESEKVSIKVNAIPKTPTLSLSDAGLTSSNSSGNQWYNNGNIIAGETQAVLKNFSSGTYFVRTTENGCSSQSTAFSITANESPEFTTMKVYPNPTSDFIAINLPNQEAYLLQIMDLQGRVIATKKGSNETQIKIDLANYHTGLYLISLSSKNRVFVSKIVVE